MILLMLLTPIVLLGVLVAMKVVEDTLERAPRGVHPDRMMLRPSERSVLVLQPERFRAAAVGTQPTAVAGPGR